MKPITDHANTTTRTYCDAMIPTYGDALKRVQLNGIMGCRRVAQFHDEEADINLCAAHKGPWLDDSHLVGLGGSRSDLIAELHAWREAGCPR